MTTPLRILIYGPPNSGKTTIAGQLAEQLDIPVRSTDDVMDLGWSESSEAVSHWFDEPGPWIIEGVAVPRAVRKWLARGDGGAPCTHFLNLTSRPVPATDKQVAMGRGVETVAAPIRAELDPLCHVGDVDGFDEVRWSLGV